MARLAQLAEANDLESLECGFDSRGEHNPYTSLAYPPGVTMNRQHLLVLVNSVRGAVNQLEAALLEPGVDTPLSLFPRVAVAIPKADAVKIEMFGGGGGSGAPNPISMVEERESEPSISTMLEKLSKYMKLRANSPGREAVNTSEVAWNLYRDSGKKSCRKAAWLLCRAKERGEVVSVGKGVWKHSANPAPLVPATVEEESPQHGQEVALRRKNALVQLPVVPEQLKATLPQRARSQYRLIKYIVDNPKCTFTKLCVAMSDPDGQAVSKLLAKLKANKYASGLAGHYVVSARGMSYMLDNEARAAGVEPATK